MSAHVADALAVEIGLTAAIVAIAGDSDTPEPMILVAEGGLSSGAEAALASGPFDPLAHRTFEIGLRSWVAEQTGVPLGYVEQLYTFGDRGRHARVEDREPHVVSVGYLALTRIGDATPRPGAGFRPWYAFFPWEDWRAGRPAMLDTVLMPALQAWADAEPHDRPPRDMPRRERIRLLFGSPTGGFNDEMVLERYELLYEAGLVGEACRDGRVAAALASPPGQVMRFDHRRILATAMGRLRAKMRYRPVIFELMPGAFTLTALQRTAESIAGRHLHKQNFRRVVEASQIVEPTGDMLHRTGGRPAALFRFRRDVLQERPAPGLRVSMHG